MKRLPQSPSFALALFFLVLGLEWAALNGGLSLLTGTFFPAALAAKTLAAGWTTLYVTVLYVLVMATLWLFWSRLLRRGAAEMGLAFHREGVRLLALGFAAALGIAALYYSILTAAGLAHFSQCGALTPTFLAANLLGALAMALTEEIFFRGFVLRLLAADGGNVRAVIISSLIFAALHIFRPGDLSFKAAYFTGIFLLGVLLARNALAFGSLWLPVGFHWALIYLVFLHSVLNPFAGGAPDNVLTGLGGAPAASLLFWALLGATILVLRPGATARR